MNDRQSVARGIAKPGQFRLYAFLVAHQHDGHVGQSLDGLNGTFNNRAGGMVATHGVQGYPHRNSSPGRYAW